MPRDKFRLATPDNSESPYCFALLQLDASKLLSDKGLRVDGRSTNEVCPLFARISVVKQARGSAYLELGDTKVICSLHGPRELGRDEFSMKGQLSCDVRLATFSQYHKRQHLQDTEEKDMCRIVTEALISAVCLEKYPKSRLDLSIIVLQDSGSALAAAISCASLALADAGVEMYDLVVGCSVRQLDDVFLVNPTNEEEYKRNRQISKDNGTICLAYMPQLQQISTLVQYGQGSVDSVNKAIQLCISSCSAIADLLRQCLKTSVDNSLQ